MDIDIRKLAQELCEDLQKEMQGAYYKQKGVEMLYEKIRVEIDKMRNREDESGSSGGAEDSK